jgi:hypothetical protein
MATISPNETAQTRTLGAQMRNVAIVQMGSIGRTDFVLVRYSAAKSGATEEHSISFHVNRVKISRYKQVSTMSLHRFLIMWYEI